MPYSKSVLAFVLLVCALFVDISAGKKLGRSDDDASSASTRTSSETEEPLWTYRRTATDGEEPFGPSDWVKGYPDCGGYAQSPINLAASTNTVKESMDFPIEFFPHECVSDDLVFEANEHAAEVYFDGCEEEAHLKFNGERYNLVQIHIHSPSEHAIGGALRAAEIHWVHTKDADDDELLVVGVLFDVSEYGTNVELQPMWDVLTSSGNSADESFEARVYDLLPPKPVFSHYMGSLTTPPCTEGVTWIVMNDPAIISKLQLDNFRASVARHDDSKVDEMGNTNRPFQPLNDRDVFLVKA